MRERERDMENGRILFFETLNHSYTLLGKYIKKKGATAMMGALLLTSQTGLVDKSNGFINNIEVHAWQDGGKPYF